MKNNDDDYGDDFDYGKVLTDNCVKRICKKYGLASESNTRVIVEWMRNELLMDPHSIESLWEGLENGDGEGYKEFASLFFGR